MTSEKKPIKVIEYNKLVRDNIPSIIENEGKKCEYIHLSDPSMYVYYFIEKLSEELIELSNALTFDEILEELADVLEVIEHIKSYMVLANEIAKHIDNYINNVMHQHNISEKEIKEFQNKKRNEKGSFQNRVYLLKVYEY